MSLRFVRAQDGALFGVCKGIARTLDLNVGLVRALWLISVLFVGAGLWLYIILAVTLPREDKIAQVSQPLLLGVCLKIAKRSDMEVGVVRFLTICLTILGCGTPIFAYAILYFVLDDAPDSRSNPPKPPSIK